MTGASRSLRDRSAEAILAGSRLRQDQIIPVSTAPPKITKDTQPTISVILWRCTVCGKWSHAKRRPRGHDRWEQDEDVIESLLQAGTITRDDVDWSAPRVGLFRPCGPFEMWEAWKVEKR